MTRKIQGTISTDKLPAQRRGKRNKGNAEKVKIENQSKSTRVED